METIALLGKLGAGLAALFLVLLALPQSKLRDFLFPIVAWTFAVACGGYVLMPIDAIPDVIPFAGWVDDAGAAIAGVAAAVAAITHKKG